MHPRLPVKAFCLAVVGALLAAAGAAVAAEPDKTRPLALRKIMQDLGTNMQRITEGISREDWETVARIAPAIGEHPQPPLVEKMRILKFAGSDAGKFKGYDEKTHAAAQSLQQEAQRGDGRAVIAAFATLQNTCLACHESFRKPFVEHFYGER